MFHSSLAILFNDHDIFQHEFLGLQNYQSVLSILQGMFQGLFVLRHKLVVVVTVKRSRAADRTWQDVV
jgi:hypothetical protein